MEELGKNNPWASEWFCPRKDYLPCQGRAFLAAEEEEGAIPMTGGENPEIALRKSKREDRKFLPN